jgi:hypothetical protein
VEVIHIQNDPVNSTFYSVGRDGRADEVVGTIRGTCGGSTTPCRCSTANPLGGDYQEYVGGTYHATEMFNFFGDVDDLVDPKKDAAEARVGWVRISDWLPWMKMGDRTGDAVLPHRGPQARQLGRHAGADEGADRPRLPGLPAAAAGRRPAPERDQLDVLQEAGAAGRREGRRPLRSCVLAPLAAGGDGATAAGAAPGGRVMQRFRSGIPRRSVYNRPGRPRRPAFFCAVRRARAFRRCAKAENCFRFFPCVGSKAVVHAASALRANESVAFQVWLLPGSPA